MNKNLILTLVFGLLISTPLHAELTLTECPPEVGILITGKEADTYCISNIKMSWWSAFTWCQAIGGKLATWSEACPNSGVGATCTNMQNSNVLNDSVWTATPYASDRAYAVNVSTGVSYRYSGVAGNVRNNSNTYLPALCK